MMHLLSHMLAEVHFRSVNKKFQHTVEWLSLKLAKLSSSNLSNLQLLHVNGRHRA